MGKDLRKRQSDIARRFLLIFFTRLLINHYTEIMIMVIIMNLYSAKTIEEYSKSLYIK